MKWFFFLFGLLFLIFLASFFWLKHGRSSEPLQSGQLRIDSDVINIEIASSSLARERGLSGRDNLPKDHGLLFIFPITARYGFWMRDMNFAIDMVWIRGDKVVGVTSDVQPQTNTPIWKLSVFYPPEAVDKVLEVPAGTVASHGWQAGSLVVFPSSTVQ